MRRQPKYGDWDYPYPTMEERLRRTDPYGELAPIQRCESCGRDDIPLTGCHSYEWNDFFDDFIPTESNRRCEECHMKTFIGNE